MLALDPPIWLDARGLDWGAVASLGDDLHDLPLLRRGGLAVAPASARPEVRLLTGALTHVDLKLYAKYESGAYKALTQIPEPSRRALAATESRRRQGRFQIFG